MFRKLICRLNGFDSSGRAIPKYHILYIRTIADVIHKAFNCGHLLCVLFVCYRTLHVSLWAIDVIFSSSYSTELFWAWSSFCQSRVLLNNVLHSCFFHLDSWFTLVKFRRCTLFHIGFCLCSFYCNAFVGQFAVLRLAISIESYWIFGVCRWWHQCCKVYVYCLLHCFFSKATVLQGKSVIQIWPIQEVNNLLYNLIAIYCAAGVVIGFWSIFAYCPGFNNCVPPLTCLFWEPC